MKKTIHLREKDKQTIIKICEDTFKTPVLILAYGSRANGSSHESSNLDLAIKPITTATPTNEELTRFVTEIRESNIPLLVDVVEWSRVPEHFREQILRTSITLWNSERPETAIPVKS